MTEKLLCYGFDEKENYYVDFYFNPMAVDAWFMADEENISVVIGGQIYELKYNEELLNNLKQFK